MMFNNTGMSIITDTSLMLVSSPNLYKKDLHIHNSVSQLHNNVFEPDLENKHEKLRLCEQSSYQED